MQVLFQSHLWPFLTLAIGITAIILMISRLRFHPFIALMLAAIFVGLLSPAIPIPEGSSRLVAAVELPMTEFGSVAGKIAIVIALASIIGTAMLESGAAERIVDWLLHTLGENNAPVALIFSGFLLSIPVFFDTVFLLLVPLVISLAQKTGKHFILYILAVCGGGIITHSLVAPTPGPLIMAENLKIDLGLTIIAGIIAGIPPSFAVLVAAKRIDRKMNLPVRLPAPEIKQRRDLPPLLHSLSPIMLPVLMISFASLAPIFMGKPPAWVDFLGNKNTAMGVGTLLGMLLWKKKKNLNRSALWHSVSGPLEMAGLIILITSAGGAFGAMIKNTNIGESVQWAGSRFQLNYILIAWLIAVVMKSAQGSGTVSMITTSAILFGITGRGEGLPYHPVYIFLAIGFGSITVSWMNDSAFWVVSKMTGLSEAETLRSWTRIGMVVAVTGLVLVWLFSKLLPFR